MSTAKVIPAAALDLLGIFCSALAIGGGLAYLVLWIGDWLVTCPGMRYTNVTIGEVARLSGHCSCEFMEDVVLTERRPDLRGIERFIERDAREVEVA